MDEDAEKTTEEESVWAEEMNGAWSVVKVTRPEDAIAWVLRIRMSRPMIDDIARYTTAVEITWHNEDGAQLPSMHERARQEAFDDAIESLWIQSGLSRLMQISTGHGVREWLYYTTDRACFMEQFNRCPIGHARYPIEISFYDDPTWQIWQEVVDAIKSREN